MELSILDFYGFGKLCVQRFPQTAQDCLRPNAFRVLQRERGIELASPNLGVVGNDRETPFFWSKKWHDAKYDPNVVAFDFPLLTMFELRSESQDKNSPFENKMKKCHTVEISVLDTYKEECTGKPGCEGRQINQIYIDTETVLETVLLFFGKIVYATTSQHQGDYRFYHLGELEYLQNQGTITSSEIKTRLLDGLKMANQRVTFTHVEFPALRIYGTKTIITFCGSECRAIDFRPESLPLNGVIPQDAGCNNC